MAKEIEIVFLEEGVAVRALLLEREAPRTCQTVWEILPLAGDGIHAAYSGTVVGIHFDPTVVAPEENATTCIQTGDVMFTHYDPAFRHVAGTALPMGIVILILSVAANIALPMRGWRTWIPSTSARTPRESPSTAATEPG